MKHKIADSMIQSAVRLPRSLHERLKKAGGERGMGEEIRRLIQEAMEAADAARTPDEITNELLALIKDIADHLLEKEQWYADRFAFDVFTAAINTLLSSHQPSGDAKPETKAKFQAVWKDENPETIGRMIARAAMYAYSRERYGQAVLEKLKERKG
jgi:hypothetical protein